MERDFARAAELYQLAVDQGNATAQWPLGQCYELGDGVEIDASKALELYTLAAKQGNRIGQFCVGHSYEEGVGVMKDWGKAVEFYELAAAQGDKEADEALERLEAQSSEPRSTVRAQQHAVEF